MNRDTFRFILTNRSGREQRPLLVLLVSLLLGLVLAAPVLGQTPQASPQAEPKDQTADPLGRDTPRGTVVGFIRAATEGNTTRAAQYLDTRGLSSGLDERIRQLLAVLNHALSPSDLDRLSIKKEGIADDAQSPPVEVVGKFRSGDFTLEITLERTISKEQVPIWRFDKGTLNAVPAAAQHIQFSLVERLVWKPLRETQVLSLPLWQWLVLPITLMLVLAAARIIDRGLFAMFRPLLFRLTGVRAETPLAQFTGPIRLMSVGAAILAWAAVTSLPLLARYVLVRVAAVLAIVGLAWLLVRLIDVARQLVVTRLTRQGEMGGISLAQLASSLGQLFVVIVAIMGVLYTAGVDLTTALAGLGIGGVAVAFAAQKTLENLFGGVMIISDQPVRVGDFCRAGEFMGTVEQIGLRSTRIRTLDRTVVCVPNAQMSALSLENFGDRDKFWFRPVLKLRHETQADQLRYVLAEVRRMFYEHPMVENDSARVRFVGFGVSSVDMEVFAYVRAGDFAGYLAVQEDLLLRIMDIVKDSGTAFAFPSSTTYIARDSGLNEQRTREAVATVGRWRDEQELPFPDFRPSRIAEFDSKLEYPPPGSDLRRPGSP